jgi:hypothetical protein
MPEERLKKCVKIPSFSQVLRLWMHIFFMEKTPKRLSKCAHEIENRNRLETAFTQA